jgi:broad specificity phosphatase PhoE
VRRRIYLMRHAAVAYFVDGRPVRPESVSLTEEGRDQSRAAASALREARLDRVVTSGLARTEETARLVAPGHEPEAWPELRELEGGRLEDIPEDQLEGAFVGFFRDVVPDDARFLGGETIGSLFDRVVPAVERLRAEHDWGTALVVAHGGTNRAILSYALTGGRWFLGNFEQAPGCLNVLDVGEHDWVVRAVNVAPYDLLHQRGRTTTMEDLWTEFRRT